MRAILISLLVVSLSCAFAQKHNLIPIPVLKESNEIDRLIEMVLDTNTKPLHNSDIKVWKKKWIVIYMETRLDSTIYFELKTANNINEFINNYKHTKSTIGSFLYKKIDVIVFTDKLFSPFFITGSKQKIFPDIYQKRYDKDKAPSIELLYGIQGWQYLYKNQNFITYAMPAAY